MIENKIVIQYKNGTLSKGKTNDFFPNKKEFHLNTISGENNIVSVEDLKAIFFVKSFEGNKDRKDNYNDEVAGGGRKVKVSFVDGETIIGYTLGYSPDRQGFYLNPADLDNNNERIFVLNSATQDISFIWINTKRLPES